MSVEKLERVMWRLRARNPNKEVISNVELRRCIMLEIGTDSRTQWNNRKALKELGWIKAKGRHHITLTGIDISGDY